MLHPAPDVAVDLIDLDDIETLFDTAAQATPPEPARDRDSRPDQSEDRDTTA